jgi:hypothetical protein
VRPGHASSVHRRVSASGRQRGFPCYLPDINALDLKFVPSSRHPPKAAMDQRRRKKKKNMRMTTMSGTPNHHKTAAVSITLPPVSEVNGEHEWKFQNLFISVSVGKIQGASHCRTRIPGFPSACTLARRISPDSTKGTRIFDTSCQAASLSALINTQVAAKSFRVANTLSASATGVFIT